MAFPVAAGRDTYSGNYIPEIWSPRILTKFYEGTCLAEICNTDYEGEIKKGGDKIIIRTTPTITVRKYVKGQGDLNFETPKSDPINMTIDRGDYWAFVLDSVDAAQMDTKTETWTQDATHQTKISIETETFSEIYTSAHASNKGATAGKKSGAYDMGATLAPVALTKDNILDWLVDIGSVLDEQGIDPTMAGTRFIVLPPLFTGLIKKSDLKDAAMVGDTNSDVIRKGRLGMINGFTIYENLHLASVTDGVWTATHAIAGYSKGITFATQLSESAFGVDNPKGFGKLFKGLQVWDFKVTNPECLVDCYIRRG